MANNEVVRSLKNVPLFEGLSLRELKLIAQAGKEVDHPSGRVIVEEGTNGVGFHLILEGSAKVIVRGKKKSSLGPGDYFGEISLIDRGPRMATVVAEDPVRTLTLSSWSFMPLVERHPAIAKKLLLGLCQRLRNLDSSIQH
ncbi:MAG TPA: cyclic nucleotide-binding domain-containing protein [Actinomycetota bacterium]|nr:cyclic nucleotide-binding domain-containing protein [Actinomycetota bacterium]